MTTLPFATASQSWATWAGDVDTLGNDLDPESLMSGLDGGPFDRILADLHAVKTNTAALALAASDLSGECKTQDLYDRALAQAPTPGQVREAEKAAEEVNLRWKYGADPRPGDQAIVNRAANLREERDSAVEQHRQDTARTTLTQPPARTIPTTTVPGFAPSSGLPADENQPPWGEESTNPVGTELSSASDRARPAPGFLSSQHAGTQTPQPTTATAPPSSMSSFTPTTAAAPTAYRRRGRDGDEDTRDLPDDDGSADITPDHGTDLSADRGGVRHGTSLSDTSGRPAVSPYGAVTAQPVAATGTAQSGYGAGGMPMMGGMGGVGHGGGERSGSGKRPEVLSRDPEGRAGDEYAFEGGLVSKETNSEEAAFLEWISDEDRETVERNMNPHVVGQR
ncbi:hypothetical protein [Mycobacteroides abscessus]|uniref:hypothetical protein n=1 Tax=Mycobacteroides abscessus TaxID=36809 RepID=UPI00092BAE3B|nr:hypothetical protein [Mycobacteroides abscessus]SHX65402.1 Uncharacterised protein [Mycobacteroides abscessus subsp. abscessus]SHZ17524.1 Uncharacterised protein [Mycobacteroides abscessus subsp. abscessus]SIB51506.1 Uncharacterised protein [Mycobacteroides abscessus subsp. abscessus]SIF17765.1 Uncharacterised protein [Mycobacteroides abscessus subsp. abscessus]SKI47939.1 Uncharacterised protein [Mycobacteroides abscessus subsp. abscessus]